MKLFASKSPHKEEKQKESKRKLEGMRDLSCLVVFSVLPISFGLCADVTDELNKEEKDFNLVMVMFKASFIASVYLQLGTFRSLLLVSPLFFSSVVLCCSQVNSRKKLHSLTSKS
jgi:hypothetical protein